MTTEQKNIVTRIQSCNSHTAIDGVIAELNAYKSQAKHESLFFETCFRLILVQITAASLQV